MKIKANLLNDEEYSFPESSDFIHLNLNESAYPVPDWIKEKIFASLKQADWHFYPSDNNWRLLSKLANYTGSRPESILPGNGSNELIQTIVYACCNSQEAIVTVKPGFSIYRKVAELMKIRVEEIPLQEDFGFDLERILKVSKKARAILLGSPHNPTGQMLSPEQIETLLSRTRALVVVDEAYAEFSGQSSIPLISRFRNLIVLRTFSKAFRLAGGRFGYAVGEARLIKALKAARLPFSVGMFQQIAAEILLEEKDFFLKEIQKTIFERERLFKTLKQFKTFKPFPSQANFLFVVSTCLPARQIFQRLLHKKILVRIFNLPELNNSFRITIGKPEENDRLLEGLQEIEKEALDG
ncbi:MAG: histidinol-phosphate transaminase [Candidatus Saccharicenans sp.]|uniref:histidinol-phosphate transaminase n=1 Tax=Candidatus Saccharicenans sp. TaxID=2819258 RepID=UPI0040492276